MMVVMNQKKKTRGRKEIWKKEASGSRWATLPDDLVVDEILTRLPAKSLLRFKSVSKKWYSTIREPTFVSLHHQRAQTRPDGGCLVISMIMPREEYQFENILFSAAYGGGPALKLLANRTYSFSTSTHGLILLLPIDMYEVDSPVFVFNSTTQEQVSLPPIWNHLDEKTREDPSIYIRSKYSLGFDPSTGQYKVLSMCTFLRNDKQKDVEIGYCLYVFTLGTKAWRKLDLIFPTPRTLMRYPCCVNGALHWIVLPNCDSNNRLPKNHGQYILAFDVGVEKFRVMPLRGRPASLGMLSEVGGRLALSHELLAGNGIPEVWVLEDYEKGEWMQVKLETPLKWIQENRNYDVGSIHSGEKFLVTPHCKDMTDILSVYYCDKSGKECSSFMVSGLPVDINFFDTMVSLEVSNNVETLFSPSAGLV